MIFGATRADSVPAGFTTVPHRGGLAAQPLLAVPVAAAVGAAAYQAVTVGRFDHVSGTAGLVLALAVGLRESLGALDVRRYAARLSEQQARFQALVAGSADVTMVLDTDLVVRWQSPAAARLLGLSDQDVLDRPFVARVHAEDAARVVARLTAVLAGTADDAPMRARLRDGFGGWRDTESMVRDMRFAPEVGALVVHVRDVGDLAGLRKQLADATRTDPLTGLPNERRLLELAASRLATGARSAIVVLGLHGIAGRQRAVRHGRRRRRAGRRRRSGCGPVPSRATSWPASPGTASRCSPGARRCGRTRGPSASSTRRPRCTSWRAARPASPPNAGVADLHGTVEADEALWHAATAADRAHARGPGRVEGYDEGLAAALRRRATIEQRLADAIRAGEFDLVYQPVVDLRHMQPVAVEALLRWRLADIGVVPPLEVVAAAEALGCVDELDTRVLRRACRQLARWRRDGHDLTIAVNVSPRHLTGDLLPSVVEDTLTRNELPASRLIVEIAARDVPAGIGADGARRAARPGCAGGAGPLRHRLARAGPAPAPAHRPGQGGPVAVRRRGGGAGRPGRHARRAVRLRGGGGRGGDRGRTGHAAHGRLRHRAGEPARGAGARRAGRGVPGGAPGPPPVTPTSPVGARTGSACTNWAV